ncbi:polysaccharide pyruvyl transferase family protein [Jannaschia seohaensis]|uniref:Exopolysaccharide biosynthesis predicted pyruvyl transferase EpsI n=1 Tax=Jannaschia seohaensis TaxID=475081 RepID=A0A2Y9B4Y4_9RHOB|nr:polysaccharide pyruvyl transferase family protein [Jannaschia seohaensis]PWJ13242.1 exopolysaccharide biosynthesis predicted pyruvyl transferase EpsI [Jannaschia seohaensis]SSA50568.1 Exopolysaccharide biosynthesis protein EpsI, predicted pyruvyl transferase [Jannaschia seohaensis]
MTALRSRFEDQNADLVALLKELSGETVIYVPNHGNAGDSLIAAATYQLLATYGVEYEVMSAPQHLARVEGRTILLGGGGNLVPLYSTMATLMRAAIGRANRVVLLPHSVRGNEELLAELPPETVLFCREALSFEHARRHAARAQVHFGHDLGLYADLDLLDAQAQAEGFAGEFAEMVAEKAGISPEALRGKDLSCIRGGAEGTVKRQGRNFDASTYFRFGVLPGGAEKAAWMLAEFVRLGRTVRTNRLHVGIAAGLAGIETVLLDNNYGKISGVYMHSMRDHFPHVTFEGEAVTQDPFSA